MFSYTKRLAHAALASTVTNASYVDINGKGIVRKDISVQDMMIEELLLLVSGVPGENFEGPGRYNGRLERVLSSLVNESSYFYVFHGYYREEDVRISNSGYQTDAVEMATYSSEISVPGEDESLTMTLRIWRK